MSNGITVNLKDVIENINKHCDELEIKHLSLDQIKQNIDDAITYTQKHINRNRGGRFHGNSDKLNKKVASNINIKK